MATIAHSICPYVSKEPTLIPRKDRVMPAFRTYPLLLIAIPVIFIAGLVWVNTAGVAMLNEAHVELPPMMAQAAPSPDNTGLWVALISSLTLNFFALVGGMFNAWLSFKLKMALRDAQASLDENTTITKLTRVAVKEQTKTIEEAGLADKSNH